MKGHRMMRILFLGLFALLAVSCVDLNLQLRISDAGKGSGTVIITYIVDSHYKRLRDWDGSRDLYPLPPALADMEERIQSSEGLSLEQGRTEEIRDMRGEGYTLTVAFNRISDLNALFAASRRAVFNLEEGENSRLFSIQMDRNENQSASQAGKPLDDYRFLFDDVYEEFFPEEPYQIRCSVQFPGRVLSTFASHGSVENDSSSVLYQIPLFDYLKGDKNILWETEWQ